MTESIFPRRHRRVARNKVTRTRLVLCTLVARQIRLITAQIDLSGNDGGAHLSLLVRTAAALRRMSPAYDYEQAIYSGNSTAQLEI